VNDELERSKLSQKFMVLIYDGEEEFYTFYLLISIIVCGGWLVGWFVMVGFALVAYRSRMGFCISKREKKSSYCVQMNNARKRGKKSLR